MRQILRFYLDCFLWAFPRSWGLSETISAAVGLLVPVLVKLIPELEPKFTDLLWQIPLSALAVVFVVRFVRAPYELYKQRHQKAEQTEHKLRDKISQLETKASAADWKDLADRFKKIGFSFSIRADWHQDNQEESWRIAGAQHRKECESLCELAGAMLLRSPNVFATLSDKVRSEPDPIERWLEFLKEREGLSTTEYAEKIGEGGEKLGSVFWGSIDNLPDVSSRACIYCAAGQI